MLETAPGGGGGRYGRKHYAPYEPEQYIEWAQQARMNAFFGNLEDPQIRPVIAKSGLHFYPSAFWLEPHWRDTSKFTIDWLLSEAQSRDVVLLIHPENVLESPALITQLHLLVRQLKTKMLG